MMKKRICWVLFVCLCFTLGWAQSVRSYRQAEDSLTVVLSEGEIRLYPLADNAVRVKYVRQEPVLPDWMYVGNDKPVWSVKETGEEITLGLPGLVVRIDKEKGTLAYFTPEGKPILQEKERQLVASSVQGEPTRCAAQCFYSPADENLFGLGQFQDGQLNVRGLSRRLTQVNTQIAVPFVLSDKGYGILWNNYGLTEFNPADSLITLTRTVSSGDAETVDVTSAEGGKQEVRERFVFTSSLIIRESGRYAVMLDVGQTMARRHHLKIGNQTVFDMKNLWLPPTTSAIVELEAGVYPVEAELEKEDRPKVYYRKVTDETVFRSPVAEAVDYTVFAGKADEVIAAYRRVTGEVPMMPRWALGYIHCRERFHGQDEIVQTATRFRNDSLPMDVIVQDWQYWGKYGWNAMRFDESGYPDPKKLVDDVHALDARLMLSVWSKIDPASEVGKLMQGKGYYIPQTSWIDFFNPDAAAYYWENFNKRLLKPYGIDAWWLDATEPENDDLLGRKVWNQTVPGEVYRNVYPLLVNRTVYEGSRREMPDRRVMLLTRSGFPGMQRYATATWSGDVGHDWETLRRQIVGGLGMVVSGQPWWTYDAGGFFRPGQSQYTDPAYHECFLRWLQAGVFLPLTRVHGYQSDTEFWNYGEEVVALARRALDTRYSLFPYIYSEAARTHYGGGTLMRPLVMDFAGDSLALAQKYEYMFGPSLLVAPVVEPGKNRWEVYLPHVQGGWYDFWTGAKTAGNGTWETVPVTLEQIPVFVKAGTILPLASGKPQTTREAADAGWTVRIYAGADAAYTVYEDNGIDYAYEQGAYALVRMEWDEAKGELTIHPREGSFPEMKAVRPLRIIRYAGDRQEKQVIYKGKKLTVKF